MAMIGFRGGSSGIDGVEVGILIQCRFVLIPWDPCDTLDRCSPLLRTNLNVTLCRNGRLSPATWSNCCL